MARTINSIYSLLEDGVVAAAAAVGITINPSKWSKYDYKRFPLFAVATAHGIQDQLFDSHIEDVEDVLKILGPQTQSWIKDKMINLFEYDATAVPIIKFDTVNFVPYYQNPNAAYRIIKYCSPVPGSYGTTLIKCAKESNGLPVQLTNTELSAAQSFADTILMPGLKYVIESKASDKLFMQLDVYYNGLYSAVIEVNVKAAISLYLKNIGYDGKIVLSDIERDIKLVDGVIDVVFVNVKARDNATSVGGGTNLVFNNTEINKDWQSIGGYIILENTSGANWMLSDYRVGASGLKNLNLIPQ